jgi:hypothetical protein
MGPTHNLPNEPRYTSGPFDLLRRRVAAFDEWVFDRYGEKADPLSPDFAAQRTAFNAGFAAGRADSD